jgi:hypothetical protein
MHFVCYNMGISGLTIYADSSIPILFVRSPDVTTFGSHYDLLVESLCK